MLIRSILAIAIGVGIYIASDKLAAKRNNPKMIFWIGGALTSVICGAILFA